MKRLSRHLSYANVVATLALVVAVAGGTTAVAVKKAGKGAVVRVTKGSDISKSGMIRPERVGKEALANNAVGANQLGELRRYLLAGQGTVACPSGERLISGGFTSASGFISSQPATFGPSEGWSASGSGGLNSVHAICLAP